MNKPEPKPAEGRWRPVWVMVIEDAPRVLTFVGDDLSSALLADMSERSTIGAAKYGTPLRAHNGRNALVDAYQEALDLCAYLRQAIEEACGEQKPSWLLANYTRALRLAADLKQELMGEFP